MDSVVREIWLKKQSTTTRFRPSRRVTAAKSFTRPFIRKTRTQPVFNLKEKSILVFVCGTMCTYRENEIAELLFEAYDKESTVLSRFKYCRKGKDWRNSFR